MATAQKAQLTSVADITWSGGALFNGYVLLIAALPSTGGATWTRVHLKDTRPRLRVPTRVRVPIREGKYDSDTQVWRTDSLVPPNVLYSSFFYDSTDRLIAIGPALFSITTAQHTLTPPALTDPTAAVTSPDPEDVPSSQVVTQIYGAPTREDVQGTKDGVNTTFTISTATYAVVMVIWNMTVLDQGVHYTISGNTITMIAPYIPDSGDSFEAVIF